MKNLLKKSMPILLAAIVLAMGSLAVSCGSSKQAPLAATAPCMSASKAARVSK